MARVVRFRVLDGVAVVTLDAPPVNALSAPLRAGLWDVLGRCGENPDIKAIVITATGKMFSAGADIREFGATARPPSLPQLCDLIETHSKPVVVAVQGQALGGGAEVALAAHYRIATQDARLGLPEVSLGLVPGAGGTQRLTRLIGAEPALQMMLSTSSMDSAAAHRLGLVDAVVQGDIASGAIAFARHLIQGGQGPRRTRDNRAHLTDGRAHQGVVGKARATLSHNPLYAPARVIDCVEAAGLLPFDAGLAFEADAFARCMDHPQSVALRHVFMAERKIDSVLLDRRDGGFHPVAPMGMGVLQRLRGALRSAANHLVQTGTSKGDIDAALQSYGFRKGVFDADGAPKENQQIIGAILGALVAEGGVCVQDQAVQRPSDIDALCVHGLGFPRHMGGPMRAAQSVGLIRLRQDMRNLAQDNPIWTVPELVDAAIKDARGFDALDAR